MGTNAELVDIFSGIADLLDLAGEKFKPDAYRRAARSIESLTEDIRKVADRGELRTVPGVGDAIEEKIREYLRDGKVHYYEKLRGEFPPGVVDLVQLPGLGPKTARRFWLELKVEGPAELAAAIDAGRLNGMKGFGPRKIALIREALSQTAAPRKRTPLLEAWELATSLLTALRSGAPVDQVEAAGSLRRRRESVGDLDILATSREPERVFDFFTALPSVAKVVLRGPTKETVLLHGGIQVDLRVVEPGAFGAALQYFTGSKDHNIRLRTLARDAGLKINEYGVDRGEERVAGATEEEVYRSLGLPWIPSEIRENGGEIEAAGNETLPSLVDRADLQGDLHLHLPDGTTSAGVDALVTAAGVRGWSYLGIVGSTHSEASSTSLPRELLGHVRGLRSPSAGRPAVYVALECDDLTAASGSDVDFVIVRPHGPQPPSGSAAAESTDPPVLFAAHLALRSAEGDADAEVAGAWISWAGEHGVGLEVAPTAPRDGLDSAAARRANEAKVRLHAGSGAARASELDRIELAVGLLRRAWVPPGSVLNASAWAPRPSRRKGSRTPPKP